MTPALKGLALVAALAAASPALAQSQPPSTQSLKDPSSCDANRTAEPATQPAPKSADGTAPGNAGSTGWSGGIGGSFVGTTQSGQTKDSKTFQPATARGLDPFSAPKSPAPVKC